MKIPERNRHGPRKYDIQQTSSTTLLSLLSASSPYATLSYICCITNLMSTDSLHAKLSFVCVQSIDGEVASQKWHLVLFWPYF